MVDVRVSKFTSICTHFTYRDRGKYAMIYRDKVFRESGENLEKSRKNEVILRYARKNQGAHDLSRQDLPGVMKSLKSSYKPRF